MATYLIDYENPVGKEFINFVDGYSLPTCCRLTDYAKERYKKKPCVGFWETVKKYDWRQPCDCNTIVLFYSKYSPQANIDELKAKCTETYEYHPNGIQNGLDFQLTTYLGSLIHGDTGMPTDSRYYIVSGDKGFESALNFWEPKSKLRGLEPKSNLGGLEPNSNFEGLSFRLLSNTDDFLWAFIVEELDHLNIYGLLYAPKLEENLKSAYNRQSKASKKVSLIYDAFFEEADKKTLHNKIQRIVGNGEASKSVYRKVRPLFDRWCMALKQMRKRNRLTASPNRRS
ncbi:MAG: hypothetical protein LBU65_12840 [Planctomycetaceae bacterium]|jgi:hypothetical protein|nr:hypothetical protein [Planctomycetaceae bacterium]